MPTSRESLIDRFTRDPMAEVPAHLRDGLRRYIVHGVPPGHFLTAVLEHDLFQSFARADDTSRAGIPALVMYLVSRVPSACHGNRATVDAWIGAGGLVGKHAA